MSPLIRQIYTNVSLAAMVPAVIWSASAYSAHSLAQVIGGFPFYYLAVSQLLVLPRYIISAIFVDKLSKSKYFSVKWGIIGMLAAGLVVDVQLTIVFAHAIANPQYGWPFVIPVLALPLGLASMVFTAAASGYAAQRRQPKPSSPRKDK